MGNSSSKDEVERLHHYPRTRIYCWTDSYYICLCCILHEVVWQVRMMAGGGSCDLG